MPAHGLRKKGASRPLQIILVFSKGLSEIKIGLKIMMNMKASVFIGVYMKGEKSESQYSLGDEKVSILGRT